MLSNNALANNDSKLAESISRLSSGLKINNAKDNPAGLAMAKRMNAQIKGLAVAEQNASDGVSIIETADGSLSEVTSMLQRINELCVQANNGTMSDADRETIQNEVSELKKEIDRIKETTQFNGQKLLNGEFNLKGYTNVEGIGINYYSDTVAIKEYMIQSLTVDYEKDEYGNLTGNKTVDVNTGITLGNDFPQDVNRFEVKDNILTMYGGDGFEMKIDLTNADVGTYAANQTFDEIRIDITGVGAMRLQIGANEGQVLEMGIPAMSLKNMGIENIDVETKAGAEDALSRMDEALRYVSNVRSRLGAYQNRMESTINSLDITSENMTAAYSRLMDVDMAEEMTNYTTKQVLTQAGTSMLAQANERPSQILQLLQ